MQLLARPADDSSLDSLEVSYVQDDESESKVAELNIGPEFVNLLSGTLEQVKLPVAGEEQVSLDFDSNKLDELWIAVALRREGDG